MLNAELELYIDGMYVNKRLFITSIDQQFAIDVRSLYPAPIYRLSVGLPWCVGTNPGARLTSWLVLVMPGNVAGTIDLDGRLPLGLLRLDFRIALP